MNLEKDKENYKKIGKKVVLCIGNDLYLDDKNYSKLKKCNNDASCVYNAFLNQPALDASKEKSVLICNNTVEKVTKEIVIDNIKNIINRISEDEQLIIFFSGHGEDVNNEFALVMYDSFDTKEESFIKISEIDKLLRSCNAKEKLFFIDACFSGLVLEDSKSKSNSRKTIEKLISESRGINIIASSRSNQCSIEKSPSDKSLFTHFLILALEGDKRAQKDYYLSIFSLYEYIAKEMIEFCNSGRIDGQMATIKCANEGIPILGDYRFRESNKWYQDNYAYLQIIQNENVYISWLNDLKTYVEEKTWMNVKNLIIEIILNSFEHGKSNGCEIVINKDSVELRDDGCKYNQLRNCTKSEGGASLQLKFIQEHFSAYVKLDYKYVEKNYYRFQFSQNEAFDITDNCSIKIYAICGDYENEVIMPPNLCKYYFMNIEECGPISFGKKWIEVALRKIPSDSKLVIRDNALGFLENIFAGNDQVIFDSLI